MLVVGLTGGIGSGKSTVAALFAQLDVPIIDADQIAHQLTEPLTLATQQIIRHFGPNILEKEGTIDRQKLRQLVFNKAEERRWLEQLLHPLVLQEIQKQLQEIEAPYILVIIPLLLETGPHAFIDRILVVESAEKARIERLKYRDQTSAEELQKIIDAQLSSEERLAQADDVIYNEGGLEELARQVEELHQRYCAS